VDVSREIIIRLFGKFKREDKGVNVSFLREWRQDG
jgi:hypothetical protein